jgi:hypothetical protein
VTRDWQAALTSWCRQPIINQVAWHVLGPLHLLFRLSAFQMSVFLYMASKEGFSKVNNNITKCFYCKTFVLFVRYNFYFSFVTLGIKIFDAKLCKKPSKANHVVNLVLVGEGGLRGSFISHFYTIGAKNQEQMV